MAWKCIIMVRLKEPYEVIVETDWENLKITLKVNDNLGTMLKAVFDLFLHSNKNKSFEDYGKNCE